MEQLLNCVGALVALLIVAAWWRHRRVRRRDLYQARLLWQVLALSLIVLFLFFAISISDDLHWSAVATEAEGSRKTIRTVASQAAGSASGVSVAAILIIVLLLFANRRLSAESRVLPIGSPVAGFSAEFSGRAPPCHS